MNLDQYIEPVITNRKLKKAQEELLKPLQSDYFITITFNKETHALAARRYLRYWQARIDRKLFGGQWAKLPANERTFFIAYPEHPNSNYHYHLHLRLPNPTWKQRMLFRLFAQPCLERVIKSGKIYIVKMETLSEPDRIRTKSYVTKDQWKDFERENYIISTEFSNQ